MCHFSSCGGLIRSLIGHEIQFLYEISQRAVFGFIFAKDFAGRAGDGKDVGGIIADVTRSGFDGFSVEMADFVAS